MTIDGGCLCGEVRYRITGAPLSAGRCHCRSCRLAAGSAAVAWITVRKDDFAFVKGHPREFRSSPPVIRTFCGTCGTSLTYQHDDDRDTIDVTTSTLDRVDDHPPAREIWLEDRVAWVALDSRMTHHPRGSSS